MMIAMIPPGPFVAPLATAKTALIKMIARHLRHHLRGGESTMNPIGITHPRSAWNECVEGQFSEVRVKMAA
jgi:hypothetical protein